MPTKNRANQGLIQTASQAHLNSLNEARIEQVGESAGSQPKPTLGGSR